MREWVLVRPGQSLAPLGLWFEEGLPVTERRLLGHAWKVMEYIMWDYIACIHVRLILTNAGGNLLCEHRGNHRARQFVNMPQAMYDEAEASPPSGHASMQANLVGCCICSASCCYTVCCGRLLYSGGNLQSVQGNHRHSNTRIL